MSTIITGSNITTPTEDTNSMKSTIDTHTGQIATKAEQSYVDNKPSGFKSLIINGGFDVWQRGTSGTVADGYAGPDRWNFTYGNTSITQTISQLSELIPGVSCRYQVRVECTTPADNVYMQYKFENSVGKDSAGNFKTLTLSFWARSIGTTQQTLTLLTTSEVIAVPLTTTWTKYIYVLNAVDNVIIFRYQQNSTIDFAMTQVQLEQGSVATPFENRPYGLELSLCQRYYERINVNYIYGNINYSIGRDTTNTGIVINYSRKRTSPSFSYSGSFRILGGGSIFSHTITSIVLSSSSILNSYVIAVHANNAPAGQFGRLTADNDINAYLGFDAEIY